MKNPDQLAAESIASAEYFIFALVDIITVFVTATILGFGSLMTAAGLTFGLLINVFAPRLPLLKKVWSAPREPMLMRTGYGVSIAAALLAATVNYHSLWFLLGVCAAAVTTILLARWNGIEKRIPLGKLSLLICFQAGLIFFILTGVHT